jgi:hypothetical protein
MSATMELGTMAVCSEGDHQQDVVGAGIEQHVIYAREAVHEIRRGMVDDFEWCTPGRTPAAARLPTPEGATLKVAALPPPAAGRFETPPELRFAGRGALRLRAADRARLEANVLAFVKEQRLRAHIGMLVRAGR